MHGIQTVVALTTPSKCIEVLFALLSHLGSEMSAAWRTRPQYVLRSYCETGRSRFPGNEDVMAGVEKLIRRREGN